MRWSFLAVVYTVISAAIAHASEAPRWQGTAADYERSSRIGEIPRNKVFKAKVEPHWSADGNRFWYRNNLSDGRSEFILVDALKGARENAFDHERVAAALAKAGLGNVQAEKLPIDSLDFADGGNLVLVVKGKAWVLDSKTYALTERSPVEKPKSLTAETKPRPSKSGGAETRLTFINNSDSVVELVWLDMEGERQTYGRVRSGDQYEQHTFAGHVWLVLDDAGRTLGVYEATEAPAIAAIEKKTDDPVPPRPGNRRRGGSERRNRGAQSPDGKFAVFAKDNNLWLRNNSTKDEMALTTDGAADDKYSTDVYWSPDSKYFVSMKTRAAEEHKVYVVESSPKNQVQPKLIDYNYLKPGDRIAISKPHLFNMLEKKKVPVSDALFQNPWEISQVRWSADSQHFTFFYNQRGHQVLRIVAVNVNGEAKAIVDEQSKTFIDYANKRFNAYLDETNEIIWMSERDGWNHLYLYDAKTGAVKNQITRGEWVVRGVDRVDEEKRQIWFRAGGIHPQQDPYYIHYCRINFDGSGLTILTEGDGTHAINYSPDGRFFVDTWSRVDQPPVSELRRTDDGKQVCTLEHADASALLATGWQPAERFVAKGRDGKTDIHGIIVRPMNFDPKLRYPVIEHIYAGPQDSFVPKNWSTQHGMRELAELGFIVVMIDGMGTSNRSKAFHDVCWKNLGDGGFPDRILWMKAAAEKYPSMDISRVGIYGGSAGGQNALRALLAHGDFYKAGAADCGCHDNRMDKIWWNELWMSWPVGPHYAEQSNVTQAHKLQGKLLLTVGEIDSNVDPASTMQVVNALIKADKDFEFVIVPGGGHGSGESPYGRRRRKDFFVRSLMNVEPRR